MGKWFQMERGPPRQMLGAGDEDLSLVAAAAIVNPVRLGHFLHVGRDAELQFCFCSPHVRCCEVLWCSRAQGMRTRMHAELCLQAGWLQRSGGFHCGTVKLSIHLIIL